MDGVHHHLTVRALLSFLLLILLQTSTEAQIICSVPLTVNFAENNTVDEVVTTITVETGVTLSFKPPPANPDNPFRLEGNKLIADRVLDHESETTHIVDIICTSETGITEDIFTVVVVTNVNDNPPVFSQSTYNIRVNEMTPVDTSVARFPATDADNQQLTYRLTPESKGFKLQSSTSPDILVESSLEYDNVKHVQLILHVQDSPMPGSDISYSASTTIMVTIVDVDNRPPWFRPCNEYEVEGILICQSSGYTGVVVLNEQETGPLPLTPGPVYAVDGDSGINEEITYSFLGGNGGGLFEINPNTGNITMLKPADVSEAVTLTVMAAQKINSNQFATTTVTMNVLVRSLNPPKFAKSKYEGIVNAVGVMALDLTDRTKPLQIMATDEDYAAAGGRNPHITYRIDGNSNFAIIDSFLFMTGKVPDATLPLRVEAVDTTSGESATADLLVEVTSGPIATTVPPHTTHSVTTTSIGGVTKTTAGIVPTASTVSTASPSTTSGSVILTSSPSITSGSINTEGSVSTNNPRPTAEGGVSTDSTAHTQPVKPSGGYGPGDMAALGVTLGVLLLICLVVIGVLVCRLQRGKSDWRKIYETNVFRSSLGQGSGGQKDGIQYTNDAFQKDEDGDSGSVGSPDGKSVMAEREPQKKAGTLLYDNIIKSSLTLHALLPDNISQADSDKADSEKEVKPILTKERRMDEGYKSVWFKEDIDPDAKEEVVIIPDSRENDSEEEDDEQPSSSREDEDDDNDNSLLTKTPKVVFNDTDLDSGLGVKMEDEEVTSINL